MLGTLAGHKDRTNQLWLKLQTRSTIEVLSTWSTYHNEVASFFPSFLPDILSISFSSFQKFLTMDKNGRYSFQNL